MKRLILGIIAAIAGLWIAATYVPGVSVKLYPNTNFFGVVLTAPWQLYIVLGLVLGLLNFFLKPLLNAIALPLRIITLGLFGFIINMALIWVLSVIFIEFKAPWLFPLLWTTFIIWVLNVVLVNIIAHKD